MSDPSYGLTRHLPGTTYQDAVASITEGLATEGFGVLTEIDVKETLKKKLDVDFRRYVILGACNPTLAHRALLKERLIGLLLPCNVVVAERDEGGSTVSIASPRELFRLVNNPDLTSVADEVESKLRRVLEAI